MTVHEDKLGEQFNPQDSPRVKAQVPRCLAERIIPWIASDIEWLHPREIVVNRRSLRRHTKQKIQRFAKVVEEVGAIMPLTIDADNGLISGHLRLTVFRELGMDVVPVIRISHLNSTQIRLLEIADNRFAERADWDEEALAEELQALLDLQVDIELTGFEVPEVDLIIETSLPKAYVQALDDCPTTDPEGDVVSREGDVWICRGHRVLCGDARNQDHMERLMNGASAQCVFTDSPYHLKIEGFASGKGKIRHPDFAEASGEMNDSQYREFLTDFLKNASVFCDDGALVYCFMDWRNIDLLVAAGKLMFGNIVNICVWTKSNGGMGSFYRSQHEFVAVFKKGTVPFLNNVELGRHGRNRTNVWAYEGANSINPARRKELALHPTVKPVRLIADALLDCTRRNDIVLDPFLGSGSTLIAAEDCGRRCYGIEIAPQYVDVIVTRWQELTGDEAVHEGNARTFNQIREDGRSPLLLPPPENRNEARDD